MTNFSFCDVFSYKCGKGEELSEALEEIGRVMYLHIEHVEPEYYLVPGFWLHQLDDMFLYFFGVTQAALIFIL